ncbi:MAG: hemolysin family protein [Planctomycetes bacterium]|nr:hemolysin family protein [Planctomycetota bacterium]
MILAMIVANGIFAAYEIALASIDTSRLDRLAGEMRRGAAAALDMKKNMEASLAVVQLGITLVGAVAAATGGAGAQESIGPALIAAGFSKTWAQVLSIGLVVIPLTFVTIVIGELVPKVFALKNKEWVCLQLSPGMRWFSLSVWPAVWLLEKSVSVITSWGERRWKPKSAERRIHEEATLQELRAIAALARTFRLIGIREEDIILNAARLSSTPLKAIMLPAQYVSMLNIDDSLGDSLIAAHHDMHTRFPATERYGDPQAITGYVNFKDIVACMRLSPQEPSIRSILRPLPSFYEDVSVSTCLEKLIHERNHITLVRGRDERVVGMVTLEDILEELVGEIHDEYDRLPSYVTKSGNSWVVGGFATLSHIREACGIELPAPDSGAPPTTVNEWVLQRLGKPVQGGEILSADGVRTIVRKVRRQRVLEAQIASDRGTQANMDADVAT